MFNSHEFQTPGGASTPRLLQGFPQCSHRRLGSFALFLSEKLRCPIDNADEVSGRIFGFVGSRDDFDIFYSRDVSLVLTCWPKIVAVRVGECTLTVDLEDGRTVAVPLSWYSRLVYATEEERQHFEIVGAGYGIHWPELDEDIGVEGLLLGKRSTESPESLAWWLASRQK